ncbi:mannosylglycerate synthase domain-containing protein [Candidatus Bipolaricaulota sp. J31]
MSLVVFPFKEEDPEVLLSSVKVALAHPRVKEVLCVGASEDHCFRAVSAAAPELTRTHGKSVAVIIQERIGEMRPGKGDGMNTALKYFLERTDHERLHFYDADIVSFSEEWITKAEEAADEGYQVVRHYFPRSSTDAMITWMITRTGFALLWPRSTLPWIEQPLGGELLLTREAAEKLFSDLRVRRQSDWGIDTLYTFSMVAHGLSIAEIYIDAGKLHKLYGALTDLKTMLIECFSAVQSLKDEIVPEGTTHRIEYPGPVRQEMKERIGYDFERTLWLLRENWTDRQVELLELFPKEVREGLLTSRQYPRFSFMDEDTWAEVYRVLLAHFDARDADWAELLFKLWIARVLQYTVTVALRGYDYALYYLHRMVARYVHRALVGG